MEKNGHTNSSEKKDINQSVLSKTFYSSDQAVTQNNQIVTKDLYIILQKNFKQSQLIHF